MLNKDGGRKYVKQTATPVIRNGILTNILMVSTDITNVQTLNDQLVEKNYQLNTLLEYLPFFVYMKDKNRNLVVAPEKAKILLRKELIIYLPILCLIFMRLWIR